jgi:hypothetical protein
MASVVDMHAFGVKVSEHFLYGGMLSHPVCVAPTVW